MHARCHPKYFPYTKLSSSPNRRLSLSPFHGQRAGLTQATQGVTGSHSTGTSDFRSSPLDCTVVTSRTFSPHFTPLYVKQCKHFSLKSELPSFRLEQEDSRSLWWEVCARILESDWQCVATFAALLPLFLPPHHFGLDYVFFHFLIPSSEKQKLWLFISFWPRNLKADNTISSKALHQNKTPTKQHIFTYSMSSWKWHAACTG